MNLASVWVFAYSLLVFTSAASAQYPPNQIDTPVAEEQLETGEYMYATGTFSTPDGSNGYFCVRFQAFDENENIVLDRIVHGVSGFEYLWTAECPAEIPVAAEGGTWVITLYDFVDTNNDNLEDTYISIDSVSGDIDE